MEKIRKNCIAKIEIPVKAKRVCNIMNRKCRSSYIKTLKIWDSEGKEINESYNGTHSQRILYKKNRLTRANKYDNNPFRDCTHGIHFFVTKQEALNW